MNRFNPYAMASEIKALKNGNRGYSFAAFDSSENVAAGDGTIAFAVPEFLDTYKVTDVLAAVHTKGITGTTEVQLRRRRAGVDADVLSSKVKLGDVFYANNGVVDANYDDINSGDQIYVDVDAVHSGTAPKGLTVTITMVPD